MAISDKRRRFCEEYIICHSKREAAIRAGYKVTPGKSIGPLADQILADEDCKAYIGEEFDINKIKVIILDIYKARTYYFFSLFLDSTLNVACGTASKRSLGINFPVFLIFKQKSTSLNATAKFSSNP